MNNDDKVKKYLESEEVPEELEPENVKKMLDEQAPKKKRSRISATGRITALIASCAVIVGSTVTYMNHSKKPPKTLNVIEKNQGTTSENEESKTETETDDKNSGETKLEVKKTGNYMSGADDYGQIYTIYKNANKNSSKRRYSSAYSVADSEDAVAEKDYALNDDSWGADADLGVKFAENSASTAESPAMASGMGGSSETADENPEIVIIPETTESDEKGSDEESTEQSTETSTEIPSEQATEPDTEPSTEESTEQNTEPSTEPETEPPTEENEEYSDTHHQEQNVLEADIMKTDGKYIYYLNNDFHSASSYWNITGKINIAEVSKGEFVNTSQLEVNISSADVIPSGYVSEVTVQDMYLYNGMIAIIGNVYAHPQYNDTYYYSSESVQMTFASFYTAGDSPQLIDTYYQDGYYNDVRIAPDGYMYLITSYNSWRFDSIENEDDIEKYIPQCGLSDSFTCMPADCILLPTDCDDFYSVYYTVIGSIDLNDSQSVKQVDSKSLMNYTGDVYCSENNLYITIGYEDTDITRLAIGQGNIVPSASGTVKGFVNDQFSMSEYNGYFRIATTVDEYEEVWHDYDEEWYEKFADKIMGNDTGYYSYENHNRDNSLYVLDMDLNVVGSIGGFGRTKV